MKIEWKLIFKIAFGLFMDNLLLPLAIIATIALLIYNFDIIKITL